MLLFLETLYTTAVSKLVLQKHTCVSWNMICNWLTNLLFFFLLEKPWHVTSVSDMYAHKVMESSTQIEEFISCNKHCLTRVYPSCSRVDSSNYNPQPYWNCGFQLGELGTRWFHPSFILCFYLCGYQKWSEIKRDCKVRRFVCDLWLIKLSHRLNKPNFHWLSVIWCCEIEPLLLEFVKNF